MLLQSPLSLPCLLLPGLLLLVPTACVNAQTQSAPQAKPAAPATTAKAVELPKKPGPVEELYKQRQYEEALRKADELRGQKQVTAENEYWAARALRVLKRADESAARFRQISKEFPDTDQAASADVDALIAELGQMPEGHHDAAALALANKVGGDLLAVADRHAKKNWPNTQARALYIAGNAFRMGHEDARAASAYGTCRGLESAVDSGYPDKCTLGLGTIKSRTWKPDEALDLYRECALQDLERLHREALRQVPRPDGARRTSFPAPRDGVLAEQRRTVAG